MAEEEIMGEETSKIAVEAVAAEAKVEIQVPDIHIGQAQAIIIKIAMGILMR